MKIKPSPRWLVSLMIAVFAIGEPMKLCAVADDGGSFFAGYSYNIYEDKLPGESLSADARGLLQTASHDILTRLSFSRFADRDAPAVGQTIRVRVSVNPTGQAINLVSAEIKYSTSTLRLIEIDSEVSVFAMNFISEKPAGTASIIAMQPSPGIATSSTVVDLVFIAHSAGRAEIDFAPASTAFANDGSGAEVLTAFEPAGFIIE